MSLPTSTTKQSLPPDVNATGDELIKSDRWFSRLALAWPLIYLSHAIVALPLLVLSIYFAIHGPVSKRPEPFWSLFAVFLAMIFTIFVTLLVQFVLFPSIWKKKARELVAAGGFESNHNNNNGQRMVLEVGCSAGSTSAIFAHAITERQKDISNLGGPSASLPTFVGCDKWSAWTRWPNTPAAYLATLRHARVPRENIIANRIDGSSKESRTRLPYADNTFSLVISNTGFSEVAMWASQEEREALFREAVRVLEPEGRMIVVESGGNTVPHMGFGEIFGGPMAPYKRILRHEMGWPEENATTRWHWGVQYLIGVKPAGVKQTV